MMIFLISLAVTVINYWKNFPKLRWIFPSLEFLRSRWYAFSCCGSDTNESREVLDNPNGPLMFMRPH